MKDSNSPDSPAADISQRSCPSQPNQYDSIQLAHGGGGRLMKQLIDREILSVFRSHESPAGAESASSVPHDSAVLPFGTRRLAFTTDSFVVQPLFFPGGDIGKLAVCGTVNDLAMAGAVPQYLSCSFVLEEGLPLETLRRIIQSMQRTADQVGVQIVTGDTKVVDRGKGDGVFINTAGIGCVPAELNVGPRQIGAGDAIILSGDVGRHGIAIMSLREGLEFDGALPSDCGPLARSVAALQSLGRGLHCLRDLTRGGLATALIELADGAPWGIQIQEEAIEVTDAVRGACELLGLDPLYVANEGRFVAFVAPECAEQAIAFLNQCDPSLHPAVVGSVIDDSPGTVDLVHALGRSRPLDLFSGEQMPRIC